MGGGEKATLEMIYAEVKKINQKMDKLEHFIIPEEELNKEELKELDELVSDAKKGNAVPFQKIRK
ncbi:hypothetical protein HY992_02595 [Candidatus Micrarchaeota archaeon]|nr:hypothetical protein [Candidatus Micrarchaeota archaeon]